MRTKRRSRNVLDEESPGRYRGSSGRTVTILFLVKGEWGGGGLKEGERERGMVVVVEKATVLEKRGSAPSETM